MTCLDFRTCDGFTNQLANFASHGVTFSSSLLTIPFTLRLAFLEYCSQLTMRFMLSFMPFSKPSQLNGSRIFSCLSSAFSLITASMLAFIYLKMSLMKTIPFLSPRSQTQISQVFVLISLSTVTRNTFISALNSSFSSSLNSSIILAELFF